MPNSLSAPGKEKRLVRSENDPYFSRSVSKAFEVLNLLSDSQDALSVSEIAGRVDLTKSFAFRLLRTLESLEHVSRSPDGRFVIAERSYTASPHLATRLRSAAREPMRELNRRFQETVSLAALFENRIEVIEVFDSPHLMRMTNIVGRILPPHASSLGKVITAYQPESDQRRLIRNYGLLQITSFSITDEDLLFQEFARIREHGYGCDAQESILGAECFGAPIRLGAARVIGALSLSMPKSRMPDSDDGLHHLIGSIQAAADMVTNTLQSS